jgi:hypothetical protein
MSELNEVALPYSYYPDPTTGRPVYNGKIYIGTPDTDPEVTANQVEVKAVQEDGSTVTVPQPVRTSAGGVPVINGSAVQLITDGEHSIKVLNNRDEQVYYAPSLFSGTRPTTIIRSQLVPMSVDMTDRFVNAYLFEPNISFQNYYTNNAPILDMGLIGSSPFVIENMPESRMDLSQGNSSIDLGGL